MADSRKGRPKVVPRATADFIWQPEIAKQLNEFCYRIEKTSCILKLMLRNRREDASGI